MRTSGHAASRVAESPPGLLPGFWTT